ncbi:unnamed protein product, partial [Choristocarpus tenellus]
AVRRVQTNAFNNQTPQIGATGTRDRPDRGKVAMVARSSLFTLPLLFSSTVSTIDALGNPSQPVLGFLVEKLFFVDSAEDHDDTFDIPRNNHNSEDEPIQWDNSEDGENLPAMSKSVVRLTDFQLDVDLYEEFNRLGREQFQILEHKGLDS